MGFSEATGAATGLRLIGRFGVEFQTLINNDGLGYPAVDASREPVGEWLAEFAI
jgi:hypothetical protein